MVEYRRQACKNTHFTLLCDGRETPFYIFGITVTTYGCHYIAYDFQVDLNQ